MSTVFEQPSARETEQAALGMEQGERQERLAEYLSTFAKYLEPPYRYDLPQEILQPGDEDYYYYMCRANMAQVLTGYMDMLLSEDDLALRPEQREAIERSRDAIFNLPPGERRTEADMRLIKESLTNVVGVLAEETKELAA